MSIGAAIEDFQRAHLKAVTEEILAKATGKSANLLSYDAVRKELKLHNTAIDRGLHEISLDAIVGSAGRYEDFTKSFFPKRPSDESRWAGVKVAVESMTGVPPIEVYKVDQVYFVIDGNHRVSIARQMGVPSIQAYVKEIYVNVSLTPDLEPEDLILKAEQSDFFHQTNLNKTRPDIDFSLTLAGMYAKLLEHIHTHRYFMGIDQNHYIEWDDAVLDWCDYIYKPVFDVIEQAGLLRKFPDRTPADMYLWVMDYHTQLEKKLGWRLTRDQIAANLTVRFNQNFKDNLRRFKNWLLDILTPDSLESGPSIGTWRKQVEKTRGENPRLFANVLVPIKNPDTYWIALEQAILLAQLENANLLGLYVQPPDDTADPDLSTALQEKFLTRCNEAGVSADFAIEKGDPARNIVDRSEWTDLIITNFTSHPLSEIDQKSKTARQTMLRRSGRPLLAACKSPSHMRRPLLAYDGSPKADEAMYVAAYLAKKHHLPLIVVTAINNDQQTAVVQHKVKKYLSSHQIKATYIIKKGSPFDVIQNTAQTFNCDLLIMGSFGFKPLLEIVLGSTVDQFLSAGDRPILICR